MPDPPADPPAAPVYRPVEAASPSGGFDAWMRGVRPRLVALARRLLWNAHDAEEVAQEALMLAFKNAGQLADIARLDTWVYRTTLNLSLSRLRRRQRAPVELQEAAAAEGKNPHEVGELAERVREAMTELPEKLRVAMVLRDLEGLDYGQMSAITGTRTPTLRLRVHRAREMVRQIVLRRWPESFGTE